MQGKGDRALPRPPCVAAIPARPRPARAAALKGRSVTSYEQAGGAQGRRGMCKECYKAAERAAWARDPSVQARRREILERWRARGYRPRARSCVLIEILTHKPAFCLPDAM